MPRPKGSKNKPKKTVKAVADYDALIAEKAALKEQIAGEVATVEAAMDNVKAQLKEKKSALRAVEKDIAALEAKKLAVEAKAAEEAKKVELEGVLSSLLDSGMSAEDIISKLKK